MLDDTRLDLRRRRRRLAVLASVASALTFLVFAPPAGRADAAQTYTAPILEAISRLPVDPEIRGGYSESKFRHWVDANGDGQNTRAEVLIEESAIPVVMDGNKVIKGRWFSYTDGRWWTRASNVQVLHVVPLKEAWESGARQWNAATRKRFANDISDGRALRVATAHSGPNPGKDPASWLPSKGRCRYLKAYVAAKHRWRLSIDPVERGALRRAVNKAGCTGSIKVKLARIEFGMGPLATVNWWRSFGGRYSNGRALAPLPWSSTRAASANNHLRYLSWIRQQGGYYCGHGEHPSYSPAGFGDRYNDGLFCGVSPLPQAIHDWMRTPLHSWPFISPMTRAFGGDSVDGWSAGGFVYDWGAGEPVTVFPAPGGVMPASRWLGIGHPNPQRACPPTKGKRNGQPVFVFPGRAPVVDGAPIVSFEYVVKDWSLVDDQGRTVPSCYFGGWYRIERGQRAPDHLGFIFPREPWEHGGRYRARVVFQYVDARTGRAVGSDRVLNWSFTVTDYFS